MNEITINLENLTNTEIGQILALAEKANKSKTWKPKDNEDYYVIFSCGDINCMAWYNDGFDNDRYALGNCFKTQEEAEWAVEYLKVKAELQRFADEHNTEPIDWNNKKQFKYMIGYKAFSNSVCVNSYILNKFAGTDYFTSEEIAQQAIDYIGEERLKKYYFRVEE